jgi:hypothetical protein
MVLHALHGGKSIMNSYVAKIHFIELEPKEGPTRSL